MRKGIEQFRLPDAVRATSANAIRDPNPGAERKRGRSEHSLCRVSAIPGSAPAK